MPSEFDIKAEMCEIGRRIYARGFASGNDGNISYRLSENAVLCTPTLVCKGLMKPEDICTVDLDGEQTAGTRKRTSEIMLHLEVLRGDPSVKSVVHCHPPHATAFGVAHEEIPSGVLPEVEIFLGVVPRAEYETPGGDAFAQTVRPFIGSANTVVLSNHGVVSWGASLERAYWHTEILDAYCRILMLAKHVGRVERLSEAHVNELLDLRRNFGAGAEPGRSGGGGLYINSAFAQPERPSTPTTLGSMEPAEVEALVATITRRVLEELGRQ